MTRLFVFLMIILLSGSTFSADKQTNQTSTLTALEVKEVTKNIVTALEYIYLYPKRATYISNTLLSESYTERHKKEFDLDRFISETRSKLVRSTLDTGIDLQDVSTLGAEGLFLQRLNGGVSTEISDENIGYIKVTGNIYFDEAKTSLRDSFSNLSKVDALIIDIRVAEKADMPLIQELVSYFVPNGTVISKITSNRSADVIITNSVNGYDKFNGNFPLYILTSSFVSGDWEFFCYSLQQLKKAIIVGESTMGVALLTKSVKVGKDIVLELPYARITEPVTDKNWQDTGVIPDYVTSNKDALNTAIKLARERIRQ